MDINNISTIAALIAGFIAPLLVKYLNLNIDTTTITSLIVLIILYISAKNPNTFKILGNDLNTISSEAQTEEEVIESNDYEIET